MSPDLYFKRNWNQANWSGCTKQSTQYSLLNCNKNLKPQCFLIYIHTYIWEWNMKCSACALWRGARKLKNRAVLCLDRIRKFMPCSWNQTSNTAMESSENRIFTPAVSLQATAAVVCFRRSWSQCHSRNILSSNHLFDDPFLSGGTVVRLI